MVQVSYRSEVFEEDGHYVSVCPELDVSSFGNSPRDARDSLHEAVEGFLEECLSMGTLAEVLEESGFRNDGAVWRLRERAYEERAATIR